MFAAPKDGQPARKLDQRVAQLRELLDKYDLLLALSAGEPGRTLARRDAMRTIAQRFPGAMREWDQLPHSELVRRRTHLATLLAEGVEAPAPEPDEPDEPDEPWLRFGGLLHAELRALLAIRRLLIEKRSEWPKRHEAPPAQLLEAARISCTTVGAPGLAQRLTAPMLTAIAVRPGARLSELAYQAVADQHGVSVAEVKQALFGLG